MKAPSLMLIAPFELLEMNKVSILLMLMVKKLLTYRLFLSNGSFPGAGVQAPKEIAEESRTKKGRSHVFTSYNVCAPEEYGWERMGFIRYAVWQLGKCPHLDNLANNLCSRNRRRTSQTCKRETDSEQSTDTGTSELIQSHLPKTRV